MPAPNLARHGATGVAVAIVIHAKPSLGMTTPLAAFTIASFGAFAHAALGGEPDLAAAPQVLRLLVAGGASALLVWRFVAIRRARPSR